MKVDTITLKNFKRFTDLTIHAIPHTAKLVLVVGPNGSGKSSLFDAFIHWYRQRVGFGRESDLGYFQKGDEVAFTWDNSVIVTTHDNSNVAKNSLYVRTAYRNDPEFAFSGVSRPVNPYEELRIARSIQNDQAVAQNFQRLVYDTISGVYDESNDPKTVKTLRDELIGGLRKSMHQVFGDLLVNNISDPLNEGTFSFEKGTVKSYPYKNLSGGEKAAFDLLLDIHMKLKFYEDAIWCIDEVETHLHTRVQGSLLKELFALVPEAAQLWITTHSLGIMRAAQELIAINPGSVAVIDFEGIDPDRSSTVAPSNLGRIAWEKMLSIALDDLSERLVPSTIVVCEGSRVGTRRKSFDAEIYNRILGATTSDVVFISGGSSNQVSAAGEAIAATLDDIAKGARVLSLCDRDDKSVSEVQEFERHGNIVLPERNLESYLFADDVLSALAESVDQSGLLPDLLKIKVDALNASVARGNRPDDLKSAAGEIFVGAVKLLGLTRAGNDKDAFMRDTLAPLVTSGMPTHDALVHGIVKRL
jgi:predicted ATPase